MAVNLKTHFTHYRDRVETALDQWLPGDKIHPAHLHEAMRYSTFNGGKRVRPLLVYLTGNVLDIPTEQLDGPACAIELIHSYSLVHDDLPAMDDDDLRRGKPTCHKAYNEATAILVGDGLQALAFHILASDNNMINHSAARLRMCALLAHSSGSRGMVGGQAIDLAATGKTLTLAELQDMHIHKTGALIRSSVMLAAYSKPSLDTPSINHLDHYAKCIGLNFQIKDDILDIEGETEILGKPQGSDLNANKATYPAIVGMDEAKQMMSDLHQEALESLSQFGDKAEPLRDLAEYIISRKY
ncbi:MAG: (2E,6E)-farnesyl diphosphate synthase [Gammaproteobacteria bacterium]|nr:(2E,6E)-farnesyl diphosphate synthase [Gammaproteobacteria bacterium]MCF6230510.1 (2E,6E)-farnesyl diphosphate synthase [Gammaproteobacteria bacterium]